MKTKLDYLELCGKTYARTKSLLVDSLFNPGGTCSGMFRVTGNGILFMNPDGSPFAFLVANRHRERFFVTARKREKGIWYMFSLCDCDELQLGLPDSLSAQHEIAATTWNKATA